MTAGETEAFWTRHYTQPPEREQIEQAPSAVLRALAFFGDVNGKRVLDLGCGDGATSVYLARQGARVVAVDSSPLAIEHLSVFCRQNQIAGIECVCADAMEIDRLEPCDAVFGSMILHHLEPFERFAEVLARALAPGGRAFFWENNAACGPLMWCRDHLTGRWGIPKYGDPVERPLSPSEIDHLRARLQVEVRYPDFYFFRLLDGYIFRGRLDRAMSRLDDFCLRHELLLNWSYRQDLLIERRQD